jgi:hypothetical protein
MAQELLHRTAGHDGGGLEAEGAAKKGGKLMRLAGTLLLGALLLWAASSCRGTEVATTESDKVEVTSEKMIIIKTPQIVDMLENGDIVYISTSHDGMIDIELKNGKTNRGWYRHSEAGKYSKEQELSDVLNLVNHILKGRPESEIEGIEIEME